MIGVRHGESFHSPCPIYTNILSMIPEAQAKKEVDALKAAEGDGSDAL